MLKNKFLQILFYPILFLGFNSLFAQNTTISKSFKKDSLYVVNTINKAIEFMGVNNDSMIYYSEKAYEVAQQNKLKKYYSQILNALSVGYRKKGNFDKAVELLMEAIKFDELNKNYSGLGGRYSSLGNVYYTIGNLEKTELYWKEALKISEKINDTVQSALVLSNLGILKFDLKQYDEALSFYQKALEFELKINNKENIAGSYINIANVSLEKCTEEDYKNTAKLKPILESYFKALDIYNTLQISDGIADSYLSIAEANIRFNKLDSVGNYIRKAEEIYTNSMNNSRLVDCLELKVVFLRKVGKFEQALDVIGHYIVLKDSIFKQESTAQIHEMEAKYQSEQKQKEIELHKLNIEQKDLKLKQSQFTQYAMAIGILLMFGLAFLAYKRYNEKQKANKLISLQKEKVELQNKLLQSKNHEITQSLHYAERIQRAIIPTEDVFRQMIPESFILFKPCDIVSGDFYWISDRSKYIYYATADCTGHGVPGGFMSMLGTALLNDIVDERKVEDPAEVLNLMREKIIHSLKQSGDSQSRDGMDMVLCRIDKDTLELQYAAANNGLYIVRAVDKRFEMDDIKSTLIDLPCDKMPIGIYGDNPKPFQTFRFQLQKGDILYTFTDGYADQFGGVQGKKMMYKRFEEKLLYVSSLPMVIQKIELEKYFNEWRNGMDQVDDVCIIGVKI